MAYNGDEISGPLDQYGPSPTAVADGPLASDVALPGGGLGQVWAQPNPGLGVNFPVQWNGKTVYTNTPVAAGSSVGNPPTAAVPVAPQIPVNGNAFDILKATLQGYGLWDGDSGEIATLVRQMLANNLTQENQILPVIRQTKTYAQRFKGNVDLLAAGKTPLLESTYLSQEKQIAEVFRAAGLPSGFYDTPDDFAKFISGEVGLPELQARVKLAADSITPEEEQQYASLYGMTKGDLTAHLLDPTAALPILQNQARAVTAAAASSTSGYGQLSRSEAEGLGALQLDTGSLQQGFSNLVHESELFNPLPGFNEDTIGRADQLGATFNGNAMAARRIANKAASHKAAFDGGGQLAVSRKGVVGLGSAAV